MCRHEEKISWKYVKIFWILEAFRRNNIMVKKICWMFLFVDKWFLPFAFFMHICKWFMDQILNFWIPILSILYTLKEKNIKYQKYWKLCSKSWFYVDIFLSWKITATHIVDFSPNLSIENRYLCIKNSNMQGQNKRYLCLSIHRVIRNISAFRQKNIDLANFSIVDSAVMIWVINLSHLMNSEVEVEEWPL